MCLDVNRQLTRSFKKRKKIVAFKKLKIVDGEFKSPVQGTLYLPGIAVKARGKHNDDFNAVYGDGVHAYHKLDSDNFNISDDRVYVQFTTTPKNIVAVGDNDIAFKQIRLTKVDLMKALMGKLEKLQIDVDAGLRSKYDIDFTPVVQALIKLNKGE